MMSAPSPSPPPLRDVDRRHGTGTAAPPRVSRTGTEVVRAAGPLAQASYSIYTTRSAQRMRALRRRRRVQQWTIGLLLVALLASLVVPRLLRPARTLPRPARWTMGSPATTSPVWDADGSRYLLAAEDGLVVPVNRAHGVGESLFRGEFPLAVPPFKAGKIWYLCGQDGWVRALRADGKSLWQVAGALPIYTRPVLLASVPRPQSAATPLPTLTGTLDRRSLAPPASAPGARPAVAASVSEGPAVGAAVAEPAVPAATRSLLVTAVSSGLITAFDADSGKVAWRRALDQKPGNGLTKATLGDGRKILLVPLTASAGRSGGVVALAGDSGRPLWRWPATINQSRVSVYAAAQVIHGSALILDQQGILSAVSLHSGEAAWQVSLSKSPAVQCQNDLTLIEGGNKLAVAGDGLLAMVDTNARKILWKENLEGKSLSRPILWQTPRGAPLLAVVVGGRALHAYTLDGHLLYQQPLAEQVLLDPVAEGGRLLLAGKDGALLEYTLPPS